MSDEEVQRETDQQPDAESYNPDDDEYIKALRDIPRLTNLATERDLKGGAYGPPPPTASRVGGLFQGCGGVLLTIISLPMIMTALWFGYYLWGPGLLLAGGLLLLGGTAGVWAGRAVAVITGIITVLGLAVVGFFWGSYVPAAAALAPLGQFGMLMAPGMLLVVLALVLAFLAHFTTLFYWKRLKMPTQRHIAVWAVAVPVLVGLALVLHFSQENQRKGWLTDHRDEWMAEAAAEGDDAVVVGANLNVTLGYSFFTDKADDDPRLDVRMAELNAMIEAGAPVVRLSAGGDSYLEEQTPRLFEPADDDEKTEEEIAAESADRIARQRAAETEFMTAIQAGGIDLFFSDSQYSPYLLIWANDEEKITWDDFTRIHEERIRRYAGEFTPAFYSVVAEPEAYEQYSALAEEEDDQKKLDRWVAHTETLIAAVQDVSPDTQIGVTVALQSDFDMDYYERVLALDGLDFVSFRAFQPAAFERLDDMLIERGAPQDFGKTMWLVETWYGYCLAPQRSMELDSIWLEAVAAYAAKTGITGVLAADFGCFVQEGGTLFQDYDGKDGRTDVWKTWGALIQAWSPS